MSARDVSTMVRPRFPLNEVNGRAIIALRNDPAKCSQDRMYLCRQIADCSTVAVCVCPRGKIQTNISFYGILNLPQDQQLYSLYDTATGGVCIFTNSHDSRAYAKKTIKRIRQNDPDLAGLSGHLLETKILKKVPPHLYFFNDEARQVISEALTELDAAKGLAEARRANHRLDFVEDELNSKVSTDDFDDSFIASAKKHGLLRNDCDSGTVITPLPKAAPSTKSSAKTAKTTTRGGTKPSNSALDKKPAPRTPLARALQNVRAKPLPDTLPSPPSPATMMAECDEMLAQLNEGSGDSDGRQAPARKSTAMLKRSRAACSSTAKKSVPFFPYDNVEPSGAPVPSYMRATKSAASRGRGGQAVSAAGSKSAWPTRAEARSSGSNTNTTCNATRPVGRSKFARSSGSSTNTTRSATRPVGRSKSVQNKSVQHKSVQPSTTAGTVGVENQSSRSNTTRSSTPSLVPAGRRSKLKQPSTARVVIRRSASASDGLRK